MSEQSSKTYMSVADTAKLLRKALKAEFPGQKFSVRSQTYAGGASIHVRWTDGVPQSKVQAVCDLYSGATFDGMIDLKSHHDSILVDEQGQPQVVSFGADFIFAEREISDEWAALIGRRISRLSGKPCDLSSRRSSDWNSRHPVCCGYYDEEGYKGELSRCDTEEYANTLVHRYAQSRYRMPLAQIQKS